MRRGAFWSPTQAAASLVRLAYLERALAHILAGWAVKMPAFEAKLAFGLHMHRAMERATLPDGWRSLLSHLDRAPTPARLVAAVYRWLAPRLSELYETHLRETDPDGDRASVELIRSFLPQIKEERKRGLSLPPANRRADNRTWFRELEQRWHGRTAGAPLALADGL